MASRTVYGMRSDPNPIASLSPAFWPAARAKYIPCPVRLDFGTSHPREIALSIAAQLLTERDKLKVG